MGLERDLQSAVERISEAREITIISHIDADGIASATILELALQRASIQVTPIFLRQLEPFALHQIPQNSSLKIFTDLGAGQQNLLKAHGLKSDDVVIVDHHVSRPCSEEYMQVNALPYGHTKLSTAGIAYFMAKELDRENIDLAKLAIIGNVGDMMAREDLGLTGRAREIVYDGISCGNVEVKPKELNCYGISTRPIHIALAYSDDPFIPGITNDVDAALRLLQRLKINLKNQKGEWLVWEEASLEDKRIITSALMQQLIAHGCSTHRLISEMYIFTDELPRTPLRNAAEYATLLNACGRWAKPLTGRAVCLGDRKDAYQEAEYMLNHHRTVIRELLQYILDTGVRELSHLQYLHIGGRFPDTIIGIGAGMALPKLNRYKPILLMCHLPDHPEITKVSMRTIDEIVTRGIDLQAALVSASMQCGGEAGGHRIAAGAYIPKNAEEEFVHCVNRVLAEQCIKEDPHHR